MNATNYGDLGRALQEKEIYIASQGAIKYNDGLSNGLFVAGLILLLIGVFNRYQLYKPNSVLKIKSQETDFKRTF